MKRRRWVAPAIAVVLLGACATWLALRVGGGPPDPSVIVLSEVDERVLRDAFNAHPERTRVMVLVSPT